MSVSSYRSQADRLRREWADIEGKRSDALSKAAKERKEGSRIVGGISRNTSATTRRQKERDAIKRQEKAADYDKKAADLNKDISRKSASLSSAQKSLERALEGERRQEERDQRRRREEERRHVQEVERLRLAATQPTPLAGVSPLVAPRQPVVARAPEPSRRERSFDYDVCLSFAGEDRAYVEWIAGELRGRGVRVFYDKFEEPELWGKDLYEHLDHIYREAARYCVLFVSEHYARKQWATHERKSAQARALQEHGEYVLPARFDDTELPGLRPTVGYLDLREVAPLTLVEHILKKLDRLPEAAAEA